jgi:tRNA G18 (ribose-2'-O)-methylase SpoU
MSISFIDNLDDPRVEIYRHLKTTNRTRGRDEFVVEGPKLLDRLLRSRFPLVSVLATDRHERGLRGKVPEQIPLYVVPHERLRDLVGFQFHQGVLACGRRRPWPDPEELLAAAGSQVTLVVCPRMNNPENLGAILRLSDVFGVDAVLVGTACPDPFSRRVLRVSMGFALWRPVLARPDLLETCRRLREQFGLRFVAAVADLAARPFDRLHRPERLALVLGREPDGLDREWLSICDHQVTIPMRPGAESLNVAVASGILLYHFTRGDEGSASG